MDHYLTQKKCQACENATKPFTKNEAENYMSEVLGWTLSSDAMKISKEFHFKDFVKAMNFVEGVADIAEIEGHHPDIHISYNRVILELWTHSIKGLSENDFIVAAKVDEMPKFYIAQSIDLPT
jgi:4a-hydroxytetrahydrobiopterin dehydratase